MHFSHACTFGFAMAALAGCASEGLVVAPDPLPLDRPARAAPRIAAHVGYFIPNQYRYAVVRTASGAASYYPYRDVESAYREMLTRVFDGVVRLDSLDDAETMKVTGVRYIVTPEMVTSTTPSDGFASMTSAFTVELTSKVRCASGALIASPQVVGRSTTGSMESVIDRGAAGRRAMGEALEKMEAALSDAKLEGGAAGDSCTPPPRP